MATSEEYKSSIQMNYYVPLVSECSESEPYDMTGDLTPYPSVEASRWKETHQDPGAFGAGAGPKKSVPLDHHVGPQRATPDQVTLVAPDVKNTEKRLAIEAVVSPGARVEQAVRGRRELRRHQLVVIRVPDVQHTISASHSREDLGVTNVQ